MNQKTRFDMVKCCSNTLAVIAGLTRNLPSEKVSSSRMGDGVPLSRNDGSSAMTEKAFELYFPVLCLIKC